MLATRSPAQQADSRANGARSHGPATDAGKARSARNGTKHGLRGGPFSLLPGEDREEFTALHDAVTADWRPRDAYEQRWVMELATLTTAQAESPPGEATLKRLLTFARYGARIDKDLGRALQALRVLRNRPDGLIDGPQNRTSEPDESAPRAPNCTNELPPRTFEPEPPTARGSAAAPGRDQEPQEPAPRTPEPGPRLNRHQRRALAAMQRRQAA